MSDEQLCSMADYADAAECLVQAITDLLPRDEANAVLARAVLYAQARDEVSTLGAAGQEGTSRG